MKLANAARDEDGEGGSASTPKLPMPANSPPSPASPPTPFFAAASGAVHTYAELTGEDRKPYEAPVAPSRNVGSHAAAAELDALG